MSYRSSPYPLTPYNAISRFNSDSYAQNGDQRLKHEYSPPRPVSTETLESLGVKYWTVPVEDWQPQIDAIAKERGYKNRDTINVTKEGLGDLYESKLQTFFEECVH